MKERYAIFGEDIHKLVKIKDGENWSKYAWRIDSEWENYYWIPIKNWNDGNKKIIKPECRICQRIWYSQARKDL